MDIVLFREGDCYCTISLPEFSVAACADWLEVTPVDKPVDELDDAGTERAVCVLTSESLDTIIVEFMNSDGESKTFTGKMSEFVLGDMSLHGSSVIN